MRNNMLAIDKLNRFIEYRQIVSNKLVMFFKKGKKIMLHIDKYFTVKHYQYE
jgi:hypothetical protein